MSVFRRKPRREEAPVDWGAAVQELRMTLIENSLTRTPESAALAAAIRASFLDMEALARKAAKDREDDLEAVVDYINQTPGARIYLELPDGDD